MPSQLVGDYALSPGTTVRFNRTFSTTPADAKRPGETVQIRADTDGLYEGTHKVGDGLAAMHWVAAEAGNNRTVTVCVSRDAFRTV